MHSSNGSPNTQTSQRQRRKRVSKVKGVPPHLLLVATDPALHAAIHALGLACARIKLFLWEHGVFLDVVADQKEGWKCVGELEDAGCAYEGG